MNLVNGFAATLLSLGMVASQEFNCSFIFASEDYQTRYGRKKCADKPYLHPARPSDIQHSAARMTCRI